METKTRHMQDSNATAQDHSSPGPGPPPYSCHAPGLAPSGNPVINQPQVTVVHQNTRVMGTAAIFANNLTPRPMPYVCRSCNHQIVTRVERVRSIRTHLCAVTLCFACLLPCACIPYFVDSCNNVDHYCPNCSSYIGSYIPFTY